MNRRHFFSLAALSIGSLFCPRPSLEESFRRDLNAWIQKYKPHFLFNRLAECPSHSHNITDPGHPYAG